MVFYFPMLAVINIFIFVCKYPTLESVQSDLALLDVAAGHFGHVHIFTSSVMSFPFCREVAFVADKAIKKAASRKNDANQGSLSSEPISGNMLHRYVSIPPIVVCYMIGTKVWHIIRTKQCIYQT